jgi:hypothetical protein
MSGTQQTIPTVTPVVGATINAVDASNKLSQLFQPQFVRLEELIRNELKQLNDRMTMMHTEVIAKMEALTVRVVNAEQTIAGVKKRVTDTKISAEKNNNSATVEPAEKFPTQKALWWRKQYKENIEFRKQHLNNAVQALIDASESQQKKANKPDSFQAGAAVIAWNYHKANTPNFEVDVGVLYANAKKAFESRCATITPQEIVSEHSEGEE